MNTGISTIAPLQDVIAALPATMRGQLANVYDGPQCRRVIDAIEEQPCGGHADEIETSVLLAIGRQHVALDKAQAWTPSAGVSGPFSRSDPGSPGFSPTGVWGDPTFASKDKGRRLLDAIIEDLLAMIQVLQH